MALSLKIEGTDRVAYLDRDSLSIEQDASSYAATASFNLIDEDGSLSIAEVDEVLIEDGSDVLFHGEIGSLDDEQIVTNNKTARRWICRCHDDHIELDNRIVEYATWEDLLYSDIEMIDDLFDAYYSSGIDYATYVVGTPLEPAMTELTFEGVSMREAISRIAERSGGQFYVHYASGTLYFHYFDSESNVAAFHLTDTSPDYATSYPYNEIHPEHDATALINAVYVVGKDQAKWVTDATSIAAYGRREAGVSNPDLLTEDALDDFGATFIAEHKDPKVRYRVITPYGSGLRAGMQIRLVCAAKSIDSTLNINRLRIYYVEDTPYWELELGDTVPDFVSSGRSLSDDLTQVMTQVTAVHEDVFDTTAPSAPTFIGANLTTGVSIDADGHQVVYIQATWGSVADADLDHYDIQISTASDFSTFVDTRRHPSDGDRIERFTGLLGNTTYYVRVRAVDWVGNYSSWVDQNITSSKDSSAPATPTGLAAAGARTLIGVSWDANSEADLGHYELQRAPDSGGSPGAWSTVSKQKSSYFVDEDFTEAEIQASTTFHYQVRAVDTSGNNSSYASSVSASLNPIGSDTIAAGAVITAKLDALAVTSAKIAAGAVITAKLDAGAVTAAKISVSTLSAITADMGTLTAGEIQVGTGTPGVDFTGFRIFSSYIAGYNGDAAQFYVDSSDGKAYYAGGVGWFDANGQHIEVTTTYADVRSYSFEDSGGNIVAYFQAYQSVTYNYARLRVEEEAGLHSFLRLETECPTTKSANVRLQVLSGATGQAYIEMMQNDGNSALEYISITCATSNGHIDLNSGDYINLDSHVLVGTSTKNSKMTEGITIDQGANDDEILAFKSSDVAHGATSLAETDTYGSFRKADGGAGGLRVMGLKDSGGSARLGLMFDGFLAENADTTKTTASGAIVEIWGRQTSGASAVNTVADGNLLCVRTQRGGSNITVLIVDEDGDIYRDGNLGTYDEHEDALAAWDLSHVLAGQWDRVVRYNAGLLEQIGVIGPADGDGRRMVSQKRLDALLMGAVGQLYQRLQLAERKLALLEA